MPKHKSASRPLAPEPAPAKALVVEEHPKPVAKPIKPEVKVEKAEKTEKLAHAEKAERTAKAGNDDVLDLRERDDKPVRHPVGAEPAGAPVKLVIDAPSSVRAQAEAELRTCSVKGTINGVVRVSPAGTVRSVSTDPPTPCVAKALKQTLGGFSEDQPFEVHPK
jgi:hypothetical protein